MGAEIGLELAQQRCFDGLFGEARRQRVDHQAAELGVVDVAAVDGQRALAADVGLEHALVIGREAHGQAEAQEVEKGVVCETLHVAEPQVRGEIRLDRDAAAARVLERHGILAQANAVAEPRGSHDQRVAGIARVALARRVRGQLQARSAGFARALDRRIEALSGRQLRRARLTAVKIDSDDRGPRAMSEPCSEAPVVPRLGARAREPDVETYDDAVRPRPLADALDSPARDVRRIQRLRELDVADAMLARPREELRVDGPLESGRLP